ncbi:circadian clock KaiB family protein [Oceanibaculum pacificum]|uniref:KaiB domain-containing protein n=1 Tax=Oceanibaculum pacificum TaxID=580166 RepID=A0A154W0Z5_9PROT|nr:circadian clock KaiB family protein [Oceanibaculum pacificum]KZD07292.1 hypothetical protein AUP43_10260 [Oceanibaculum pacificum]
MIKPLDPPPTAQAPGLPKVPGQSKQPPIRLQFFVAYSAPSSRAAMATLESVMKTLEDRVELEVIDVIRSPERALEEGILVTPALIRLFPGPKRTLIGDLRSESALRRFLHDSPLQPER